MITSFLALEPTIQRHGTLSIGLSLKFHFIARQQEGLLFFLLQALECLFKAPSVKSFARGGIASTPEEYRLASQYQY